jgi:hypothetical protein
LFLFNIRPLHTVFIFSFFLTFCPLLIKDYFTESIDVFDQKIKGITVVAPPKPIGQAAFTRLKDIHTDWVAFVPYGFSRIGNTDVVYNVDRQWWGEKLIGIETCIKEAKAQGLKVMLKPQVFVGGGWIGDLDFDTDKDWTAWETSYRSFIFEYLKLAVQYDVELFCIGTEIKMSTSKRQNFWKTLIKDIKLTYKGAITYSANWDDFEDIGFWKDLDYIGISSYFPLTDARNPTLNLLNKEWKPIIKRLKSFSTSNNRKILFTEYGYMSVDGCAGRAWEIEKNLQNLSINQRAQCTAYDALWSNMVKEEFWAGGFLWKWFPDGMGHEGYPEKDYTPQNKEAELVIKKWFNTKI